MQNIITKKLSEGYVFKASEYIKKGLENFTSNIVQYVVFALLISGLTLGLSLIPVGSLVAALIVAPLAAGAYFIVAEKVFRKEKTSLQDFMASTNYFGGLFLANFLQILVIIGISIGLVIFLIFPMIAILKNYDFSQGVMASGAIIPIAICLFLLFFIIIAFFVWYTFTYNYVVFAKLEGSEAMGVSRRIVMKQYTAIFFFIFILSLIGFFYSAVVMYFTGQFEIIKTLIEAMINQDTDALQNMKESVNYSSQIISTLLTSFLSPLYHCIIQAAFRDINEMDNENNVDFDNTVNHLIDNNEL